MASRNRFFEETIFKAEKNLNDSKQKPLLHSFANLQPDHTKFTIIKEQSFSKNNAHIINGRTQSPDNRARPFYSRDKITPDETSPQLKGIPIVFIKNSDPTAGVNCNEYQKLVKNITNLLSSTKIPLFDVDNYKMLKQIGEGSYGIIYLVEENKTHKKCALKKIIAHDYDEVKAFLNEFSLVHSIKHPNIMKIYGICVKVLDITTIAINVLMEMANADWDYDIKRHKEKNTKYTEKELISILRHLVCVLTYLQENKISHRDIKPQNVLIYRHGVFKVADFGEAKEVKLAKQVNTVRGTEFYMSPILYESVKQNCDDVKHNTFKSDVFSLGYCFIYAATLNFKAIFDIREVNDMEQIEMILKTYFNNYYSQQFIECILKMIEIDETKRFDFIELKEYINENFGDEAN
jgi:hypothetical protein